MIQFLLAESFRRDSEVRLLQESSAARSGFNEFQGKLSREAITKLRFPRKVEVSRQTLVRLLIKRSLFTKLFDFASLESF